MPLWFDHPNIPNNKFNGASCCGDLWLPMLAEAGVKSVISGHTATAIGCPQMTARAAGVTAR